MVTSRWSFPEWLLYKTTTPQYNPSVYSLTYPILIILILLWSQYKNFQQLSHFFQSRVYCHSISSEASLGTRPIFLDVHSHTEKYFPHKRGLVYNTTQGQSPEHLVHAFMVSHDDIEQHTSKQQICMWLLNCWNLLWPRRQSNEKWKTRLYFWAMVAIIPEVHHRRALTYCKCIIIVMSGQQTWLYISVGFRGACPIKNEWNKYKKSILQNGEGYRDGRLWKTSETRVPYPIPISLFLYVSSMKPLHSAASCFAPITKQRYRDGVWNSCFTCFS